MNIDKMLATMRQQQEELTIAIRVFDRLTGNRHRQVGMERISQAATLAMMDGARRANGNGHGTKRGHYKPRELPTVTPLPGLKLADTPLPEAIQAVLSAAKRPLDARTVTAYLNAAGRENDPRGVGVALAKSRLVRTKDENGKPLFALRTWPVEIAKPSGNGKGHKSKKTAQRQRSARYLATFSTDTPKPLSNHMTALARRGYLAKRGDGWVRTEKAFQV